MKKDEFIQFIIDKDTPRFLDEHYPKDDYTRDRAKSVVTRLLIWLRDEYANKRREVK